MNALSGGGSRSESVRYRREKKRKESAELWQVVYLDFITTVMLFFFTLWAAAQSGSGKGIGQAKIVKIQLTDPDPSQSFFEAGRGALTGAGMQQIDRLMEKSAAGFVPSKKTEDEGTRTILMIEGHTDHVPTQQEGGNIRIGFERAYSTMNYIKSKLDTKDRESFEEHVAVCSFHKSMPVIPLTPEQLRPEHATRKDVEALRRKNRRIVIRKVDLQTDTTLR